MQGVALGAKTFEPQPSTTRKTPTWFRISGEKTKQISHSTLFCESITYNNQKKFFDSIFSIKYRFNRTL